MSVYEDSGVCARVAEIGQKIVDASGNQFGFSFHFYVLNSPDVTTFSAPGGPVYVTTGLLRHLQSEDELAVMLGHEIAHINKRHMMKTEGSERSKIFWGRVFVVGSVAAGIFAGAAVQIATAKAFTNTVAIAPQRAICFSSNTVQLLSTCQLDLRGCGIWNGKRRRDAIEPVLPRL